MTPELKKACEVIFQEHKTSSQIKWDREAFRGRISIGLSEMAKQTLVKRNIILLPDKSKKIVTLLNPAVASAGTFEEADEMIVNKVAALVTVTKDEYPVHTTAQTSGFDIPLAEFTDRLLLADRSITITSAKKWYMKPVFCYVIWPLCAMAAGALIAYLLGLAYIELIRS
ncbi:MAG: hypothetical protein JNN00_14195 [Chitinophagaceae bacterium]|nr:hypothetical protein [Chitinophagaceae bacterium]